MSTRAERPSVKVILVGSSGVGKTTLISAFSSLVDDSNSAPTVSLLYSTHTMKNSQGKYVHLHIWDTAGQEKYHSIAELFFRDSDVAFVCMDVTDPNSIDAVPEWIARVQAQSQHCKLFLVMTKSDLRSSAEISTLKKEITDRFARFNTAGILVTSAKTGAGVRALFAGAADSYEPNLGRVPVREKLLALNTSASGCC